MHECIIIVLLDVATKFMHACISAGFLILSAGTLLYAYFWLLYICHLTLKIFCPLKSAKLLNSHYKRVIYITGILTGISVTIVPSIVNTVLYNYEIVSFPPVQCGNSNRTYHFYTVIFPLMITVCICGILMSLILYKIHVVSLMV